MDQTEIAWGAGFFDGEGSSGAYAKRPKNRSPHLLLTVSVGQSSTTGVPDTLLRLQAVIGGKIYALRTDSPSMVRDGHRYKPKYKLQLSAAVARRGMAILIPYLSDAKLDQYCRAIERIATAKELRCQDAVGNGS